MKLLNWDLDSTTKYWAELCSLPLASEKPQDQYDGLDRKLWPPNWETHILRNTFPSFCKHPNNSNCLLASPENIVTCLENDLYLEGLAMVVAWGTMARTKSYIYTHSLDKIENNLKICASLIIKDQAVENAWMHLESALGWTQVMCSKYLHFQVRALGFTHNPPVPIDNKIIHKEVWPDFLHLMQHNKPERDIAPGQRWWDYDNGFMPYLRYMTAIICWAQAKGWTTTEMETTIFHDYVYKAVRV